MKSCTWIMTSVSRSRDFWVSCVSSRREATVGLWQELVPSFSRRRLFASSVRRTERNCRPAVQSAGQAADRAAHWQNLSGREDHPHVRAWARPRRGGSPSALADVQGREAIQDPKSRSGVGRQFNQHWDNTLSQGIYLIFISPFLPEGFFIWVSVCVQMHVCISAETQNTPCKRDVYTWLLIPLGSTGIHKVSRVLNFFIFISVLT